MSQTKKHSRLESILAYYILWKLHHQPQLIQKIVRPYLGSGLSKHDNAFHTETYLTATSMGGPYVDESGDTMTGNLNMGGQNITNVVSIYADGVILDKTNADVVLYRKGANNLGIADSVTIDTGRLYFSTTSQIKDTGTVFYFTNTAETDW